MKKVFILYGLLVASLLYGCKGKEPAPSQPKQGRLYLSVKEKGSYLADSLLDQLRISYDNKGNTTVIDPTNRKSNPFDRLFKEHYNMEGINDIASKDIPGLISSAAIPQVISRYGITDFYLTYADGGIDTLTILMDKVSVEQMDQERCKCIYPIRGVRYRGRMATEDTTIHPELNADPPVFVIEKR